MSAEINYKSKYMELRSRYMNDLDMAFRLGFEQGGQQEQQNQMMQQQQQAQEVEMAAAQGQAQGAPGEGQPGQPQDPGMDQNPASASENPNGSELDQHIAKLETMIAKSEDGDLKKSFSDLQNLRKKEALNAQIRKNDGAIKAISRALHKPAFKLSKQASANLNDTAKRAVSMQHKIVTDVMQKMEAEEQRASQDIKKLLADITKE